VGGGLFFMNFAIFLTEYSERMMLHGGLFYEIAAVFFPFALCAFSRAGQHRWSATIAAGTFMTVMLVLMWFIQLFPATPRLGPIYQHIGHMVTLSWPLWLIAPAIAIDWLRARYDGRVPPIPLAALLGVAFLVTFITVEWPFATYLVENPAARNWFFNAANYVYWAGSAYIARSHTFSRAASAGLAMQLTIALVLAMISSTVGLAWGRWLTKVRR
jgi:hypothetical protein